MGVKKKKRGEIVVKNIIGAPLGAGGGYKSVRTFLHVRHFPNLPCGEITIEGLSPFKHCITTSKKSRKKESIKLISAGQKKE